MAGADQYTFHLEATDKPVDLINQIKKAGMKIGIGIKPNTAVESVLPFVELVDMVLIMTVEPGFGGQKFMADMMPKVKCLRKKYQVLDIDIDGGVGIPTIAAAAQSGANMIVSGSAVVKSDKPKVVIDSLRATTEKWIKINFEASQRPYS